MPQMSHNPVRVFGGFGIKTARLRRYPAGVRSLAIWLVGSNPRRRKSCAAARALAVRIRIMPGAGAEGNALVEFALVTPLLMALMTGMITFGMMLSNYVALTNAVDTGARLLAVSRGETTDPCATTVAAIYAAAPQLTQSNFTFTFVLNGNSYSGTTCAAGTANLVTAEPAEVTATYPAPISLFGWSPSTLTLSAQTTELVQ